MTLELALLDKFLCLESNRSMVPIGELSFLGIVNWPPPRGDINATRNAHLLPRLLSIYGRLCRFSVARVS